MTPATWVCLLFGVAAPLAMLPVALATRARWDRERWGGLGIEQRARVLREGERAIAVVGDVRKREAWMIGRGKEFTREISLEVRRSNGEPMRATARMVLSASDILYVAPGNTLPVRILDGIVLVDLEAAAQAERAAHAFRGR